MESIYLEGKELGGKAGEELIMFKYIYIYMYIFEGLKREVD